MVLNRANKLTKRIRNLRPSVKHELTANDVQPALDYIQAYWHQLERYHPHDDENLVGLPKPFLVPSFEEGHEFDYNEMYYWDSFFMVQGILDEQHKELVIGILENLVFLYKRFKIIPNASRLYLTSRSQPPFLTSFIWQIYETYDMPNKWLDKMMKIAQDEYQNVWMGTRKPNARQIYRGLSRYYDFNYLHDIAETESGWDMTPRFNRQALDYLPADLNALLYKYEMDIARYYHSKNDSLTASAWEQNALERKKTMDELMWNSTKGMFFDYNYVKERRGTVSSLATYFTMWSGMASEEQAAKMVKALRRFEFSGGLATTDIQPSKYVPGVTMMPTQWAYPNGWAPLQFIVVEGLEKYGYHEDAKRVAIKWIRNNLDWYNNNGVFLEKYNVVNPTKPPEKGLYPSQTGFGWTNAVFVYFCKKYIRQ
jgi:alpha,alpha-trehalase